MEENLIIIGEGGIHTIEYIHRHKIFPEKVLFNPLKFEDVVPYLNEKDEILVIIKGLTDFTMAEIYALFGKLEEHNEKISDITILSNIKLGVVDYDYYLYSGDLFYGGLKYISDSKEYPVNHKGEPIFEKKRFKKQKLHEEGQKNPLMVYFTKYNDYKTKLGIFGKDKKEIKPFKYDEFREKIVDVDFFKGWG